MEDLRSLWEYIKLRQSRLRTDLTEQEQAMLRAFIFEQQTNKYFILSKGALEAYLPVGYRDKDLEKLIRLTADSGFWNALPEEGRIELDEIITATKQWILAIE